MTSNNKMKRIALYSSTRLEQEIVDIPEVPEEGYLLKVAFAGVCHSELWLKKISDTQLKPVTPIIGGHEIAGYVHKIGPKVKDGDLKIGDAVLVYSWAGCADCDACKEDFCLKKFSPGSHEFGVFRPGGFQEYVAVPRRMLLIPLPSCLPLDRSCQLACSGLTSFNAVSRVVETLKFTINHHKKASLLILGAGGLGLWALRWAKHLCPPEVKIVVADMEESKLKQAKEDGAGDVVHLNPEVSDEDLDKRTLEACQGGVNACLDFVNVEKTFTRFNNVAAFGAKLVMVGLMGGTFPPLHLETIPLRNLTFQGAYTGTLPQQREIIRIFAEGKVTAPPTTEYRLEDLPDILDKLANRQITGRAVIKYDCPEYEK